MVLTGAGRIGARRSVEVTPPYTKAPGPPNLRSEGAEGDNRAARRHRHHTDQAYFVHIKAGRDRTQLNRARLDALKWTQRQFPVSSTTRSLSAS
jgi:hypothetical protein